jgi:putative cell wall-binding protein
MSRFNKRTRISLVVALVALVASFAIVAVAYGAAGDSEPNATDLAPYLGSSLTTDLVANTSAGVHTAYYFKVELHTDETLKADLNWVDSNPAKPMNLKAIVFDTITNYPSSVPLSSTSARLTFTAPAWKMYTIYVAGSNPGAFTIAPSIGGPRRISGANRYDVAVNVAREAYGAWSGVTHIVIASGEDRAAADPLSAAGLCGVYDAPLFTIRSTSVPAVVKAAVKEIAAKAKADGSGPVTVHIVGGTGSVPDARYTDLVSYVGSAGTLAKDRILATGTRYDLAAAIARRMKDVTGFAPATVLIANGADANTFFDPLALSPIAAARHYPILLVTRTAVPSATKNAISSFGSPRVIIGGGPATVYDSVKTTLGAERWYGPNRYSTAVAIANHAMAEGWLTESTVGIAAKLPDALTGGSMVGKQGGVLLVTRSDILSTETGNFLASHKADIDTCYVFGGTASVPSTTLGAIAKALLQ